VVFVSGGSWRWREVAASVTAIICGITCLFGGALASATPASAQEPPNPNEDTAQTDARPMRHPLTFSIPNSGRTLAVPGVINPTPRGGYSPAQLRAYLGLSGDGRGQTIGITVAYDTPTIRADVARFSTYFGLPLPCDASVSDDTGAAGCFPLVVAMPGGQPIVDDGWAIETALDVEWAHAIAPRAKLLLVEAINVEAGPLFHAVDYAAKHGASVISNSWLGEEFKGETKYDRYCHLEHAVCVFATGDDGHEATYPAVNPDVLAVGGTTLALNSAGGILSEVAWSGSGGGVSVFERRPRYQADVNAFKMRGSPDASYNADIRTGVAVFVGICSVWLDQRRGDERRDAAVGSDHCGGESTPRGSREAPVWRHRREVAAERAVQLTARFVALRRELGDERTLRHDLHGGHRR
jgi:subtilase family serine protease